MNFHPSPEELAFQSDVRAYLFERCHQRLGRPPRRRGSTRPEPVPSGRGWAREGWLTVGWGSPYGEASPVKAAMLQGRVGLPPRAPGQRPRHRPRRASPPEARAPGSSRKPTWGTLAEGREWWCVGFTEPLAGTDLANIRTRATKHRDGSFILNGQKDYGEWAQNSRMVSPAGPDGGGFIGARRG